jgi:hypothetical protein
MQPQKTNNQLAKFNPSVENLSKELIAFTSVQSKHNGSNNLPINEMEYKTLVLNGVTEKTNAAIYANQEKYLPITSMVIANKINNDAKEKVQPLYADLQDKELSIANIEQKQKNCGKDNRLNRIRTFVKCCIALISIAEGWFAFEAMRFAGFPFWGSLFGAIGIAICIALITHIGAKWIKNSSTKIQSFSRAVSIVLPICIGLYFLGQLRADGYAAYASYTNLNPNAQNVTTTTASPEAITAISILLFVATLIASVKYAKTNEEEQNEKEYQQLNDVLTKGKRELKVIQETITKIEKEAQIEQAEALRNYETAVAIEKQLHLAAYQAINEYNQTNIRHRKDRLIPSFFSTKPTLELNTFFKTQINTQ